MVEKTSPALAAPEGRLLLGFSKSGWGAWSLLLRHPKMFSRAAAWDAPLMMDRLGKYGTTEILGTQENFERYRIADLLCAGASRVNASPRLILTGYGNFREHHEQTHKLLVELKIPHEYRDGPPRKHDWHSGWVAEAVELLVSGVHPK
jgi:enterochelin esterase-like enzyme